MPISCRVTRGDFTESIHVAFAVIVDSEGQIIYSTGDPHYLTCIRSSLKPFQAAASVKAGAVDAAGFDEKELALMCASHKGEDIHVTQLYPWSISWVWEVMILNVDPIILQIPLLDIK